jgi:tetratricopeptide (TPR) repeat protein
VNSRAQAERQYANGRYADAADSWRQAARSAEHRDDQTEALYRAAAAYQRAGESETAREVYAELLQVAPDGARAARAAYELAWLDIERGDVSRGERQLLDVTLRYQDSALAGRAIARLVSRVQTRAGTGAALALVQGLMPKIQQPELAEQVRYSEGRLLRASGEPEQARDVFLKLATDFPYPQGAYWEDALWSAADIEQTLDKPSAAIAHLERMLVEVEPAHMQGSYTRTRYAEARFRIAEIYRDDLHQPAEAMKQFRKVFNEHPTSLLRDDALWQEALIGSTTHQSARSCDALSRLVAELPESRYAPCAPLLCDELAERAPARTCRPYIRRSLEVSPTGTSPQSSK